MTSKEFEEMFGNTSFGTMIIIRDWVNKHYVSKNKIKDKIKEIEEHLNFENTELEDYAINVLNELLEE